MRGRVAKDIRRHYLFVSSDSGDDFFPLTGFQNGNLGPWIDVSGGRGNVGEVKVVLGYGCFVSY